MEYYERQHWKGIRWAGAYMLRRSLGLFLSACTFAACSSTAERQAGPTVPASIPAVTQEAPTLRTPESTASPAPSPVKIKPDKAATRLPDIFRKEPSDPKKAYRNLIARSNFMRGQKKILTGTYLFQRGTYIYKYSLAKRREARHKGLRYIGGTTQADLKVVTRGADTAVIEVRDKEMGWKAVDRRGRVVENFPTSRSHYFAFLRRLPRGWRVYKYEQASP